MRLARLRKLARLLRLLRLPALRCWRAVMPGACQCAQAVQRLDCHGVHSTNLPTPLLLRTSSSAQHQMLYSQAVFTLASALLDGSYDVGPMRLVPFPLSMSRLAERFK